MKNTDNLMDVAMNIRKNVLKMSFAAKSAHLGGSLSCIEILASLYFKIMNINPKNPYAPNRDRLVFSKAHDCKALYAALSERGFFNKKLLNTYETDGGLPGHSTKGCVPGVEATGGSLGHGLSIAAGIAYTGKIDNKKFRVFAVLSDGECDEGSTWEAILFAGHHKLDNLVVIIDYNKIQSFGFTKDILNLEPITRKFEDFGWTAKEVDGHNIDKITQSLYDVPYETDKPSVLIAHTIKGFGGVPKYINTIASHYKPPNKDEYLKLVDI